MRIVKLCVCLLFSSAIFAQDNAVKQSKRGQEPEASASVSLPVKKVILYKNGVGYFEHTGRVRGSQDFGIEFTTAQLNDVLKSLTLVDLNGGRIGAVRYNSVAPLDEQLKNLQIPLSEEVTSAAFLVALRGTRVEVRNGAATATGKVFSIESIEKETARGGTIHATQLAIVTDDGEMRLFELGPGVVVRAAEPEIHKDLNHYLNLIGSTRSKDVRRMTVSASGSGERELMVSYISEVPVWKSTYRIVLPRTPGKPFLQGWAIVDNTVGEDWKDVKLSLVSGTPQSFIQNISQPYYTRRPVVPLPESMMLTPQAHEASMQIARQARMQVGELMAPSVVPQGMAGGVPGGVAGGSMGGVIGGVIGGVGGAPPPPAKPLVEAEESAEDSEVTEAFSNAEAEAEGTAVGGLFEYNLKERITVLKNQSALVPIVQSPIETEKITLVTAEESGGLSGAPLRALWLRNTSGLTLDGGTFNVLEEDAFAGEGILELLHPGERRLLSYAADKAVRIVRESPAGSRTTTRVTILKGVMAVHQEERDATTYIIHNADTTPRQVILEHPIRSGWKLVGEETKPEESSATHYRFRIAVEPGKTEKFSVKESRPEVMRIYLSTLTDSQLAAFVHEGTIKPAVEVELRKAMRKKFEIFNVEQEIKSRQQESELIDKDQARLRENMKALRGSPEEKALLQRYTRELDAQEDRLAGLRKEISDLKAKRAELQAELDTIVMQIGVDETL
ncbi:MAG: hypothetical protein DMG39_28050 [Acidobacteria bacterium]|nr:MAG: hypothetical protein DMG39_28050 [Acidobacteriota bacterium]